LVMLTSLIALGVAGSVTLRPVDASITIALTDVKRQTCRMEVRNATDKPVQIWLAGFWPNHRMKMWDEKGKAVPLTDLGLLGDKRFDSPARDKNAPMVIDAGKSYRYDVPPLINAFRLKTGRYTLSVEYRDLSFGKPLHLTSGTIRVRVVK
jgi:hypothetical protein